MSSNGFFKKVFGSRLSKLRQSVEYKQNQTLSIQSFTGLNSLEKLPPTPWRIEAQLSPIYWTDDDQAIFTYHEGSKARCLLRIGNESEYRQSLLIAFDLESNQVLLDYPFPHVTPSQLEKTHHISLILNAPSGRMTLSLKFVRELNSPYESAMVLTIVDKKCHSDRRMHRRVYFDKDHSPKASICFPMKSKLSGQVLDLSETGLCMKVYGARDISILRQIGECTLDIDKDFSLRTKVEVRDSRFTREPCAQTRVRLVFCDLCVHEQDRLRAFILAMDSPYLPLNAA